jgi:8-oxo-dGTP pyrophosphatase MutT (NUDIX family)
VPAPWRQLGSELAFDDPWFRVRRERVEVRPGRVIDDYSVAERADFALVAAVSDADELVLVRQWKQGIRAVTLELPGGVVDDEEPAEAAARELAEETGFACAELRPLGSGALDPSKETTRVHLFAGVGAVRTGEQRLDENEEIEVVLVPVGEVRGLLAHGEVDAPTSVAGIYLALDALGRL